MNPAIFINNAFLFKIKYPLDNQIFFIFAATNSTRSHSSMDTRPTGSIRAGNSRFRFYGVEINITGPIVQWIEYQIPVLTIWVRVPVGSQIEEGFYHAG